MLMGSVIYFDEVDVMVILGTSLKYRQNEVTEQEWGMERVHAFTASSLC